MNYLKALLCLLLSLLLICTILFLMTSKMEPNQFAVLETDSMQSSVHIQPVSYPPSTSTSNSSELHVDASRVGPQFGRPRAVELRPMPTTTATTNAPILSTVRSEPVNAISSEATPKRSESAGAFDRVTETTTMVPLPVQKSTNIVTTTQSPPTSEPAWIDATELEAWNRFKLTYRRSYLNETEEHKRRNIFIMNRRFIEEHNVKEDQTYKLGVNHFADMTRDEINRHYVGPEQRWLSISQVPAPIQIMAEPQQAAPVGIDYSNITAFPVANQGTCCESSIYAIVANIESVLNMDVGRVNPGRQEKIKLSERYLMNCLAATLSPKWPSICVGSLSTSHVFDYLQKSGLYLITDQAYEQSLQPGGQPLPCQASLEQISTPYVEVNSFLTIHPNNFEEALINSGPVVVSLDASQSTFHFYRSGLYQDSNCSKDIYNQHVLLIGFSTASSGEWQPGHYRIRNSFGSDWGEDGHMRILKDVNNPCMPQNLALFPNLSNP